MEITIQELAALVGGQLASGVNAEAIISGAAAVGEAGAEHVTFFAGNARYVAALKTSRAGAALVPLDFTEEIAPVAIRVASPSRAFTEVVARLAPPPVVFAAGVHPTAVIGEGVQIGEGASIQPHSVIESGASIGARAVVGAGGYVGRDARIGDDSLLHPRVTLAARCVLGARVILHSGVVIGSDGFGYEFSDGRHIKIPQTGIVQIDDDVEIGANSTIDRARFGRTWIQQGTKIDNLVQVAHNVVIGKHCIVCALTGIAGSARLGNYVILGGQVGTVGHIEIGDQVTIGAKSGVNHDLLEKGIYMGTPAIPAFEWRRQLAQIHRLEKLVGRVRRAERLLETLEKTPPPSGE